MHTTLFDEMTHKQKKATVFLDNGKIYIRVNGYGTMTEKKGYGLPIAVETWDNNLRALLWTDIDNEDPEIISMENAKEKIKKSIQKESTGLKDMPSMDDDELRDELDYYDDLIHGKTPGGVGTKDTRRYYDLLDEMEDRHML